MNCTKCKSPINMVKAIKRRPYFQPSDLTSPDYRHGVCACGQRIMFAHQHISLLRSTPEEVAHNKTIWIIVQES